MFATTAFIGGKAVGEFERAYAEMEQDAGPVFDGIKRAIQSLQERPLIERMDI